VSNGGYREEVLNVLLAQLLDEQGIVSAPEQSIRRVGKGRRIPDVVVLFQGLRTAIEGKVDDNVKADDEALKDAIGRVEQGIAHIGVSVLYPAHLRQVPFHDLKDVLSQAKLRVAIYSEAGAQGWTEGDLGYLGALLRRTFEDLVKDDIVEKAVAVLEAGIETFATASLSKPGTVNRLATVLGIGEPPKSQIQPDKETGQ
jgi:hypothetical protein